MRYRASVHIKGAMLEKVYRRTLDGVRKAGIKKLTAWEPGAASLWPDRIEIQQEAGNRWETIETIKYSELPNDQHEWRKPR